MRILTLGDPKFEKKESKGVKILFPAEFSKGSGGKNWGLLRRGE